MSYDLASKHSAADFRRMFAGSVLHSIQDYQIVGLLVYFRVKIFKQKEILVLLLIIRMSCFVQFSIPYFRSNFWFID